MPAQALTRWQGLDVTVEEDGSLQVALAETGEVVLDDVAVGFDGGWQRARTEVLVDEVEQHWLLEHEGAVQARAVVRHVFDDAWRVRVQLQNLTDVEIAVPPCRLDMSAAWPMRRWLAGAEGQISIDAGREDGQLLTLTQLRGRSRLSEGHSWLTDLPVRLGPAVTPSAGYQVGWRGDWLRDQRVQAAALPSWWPARTVLADAQESVRLDLPDAAIEAAGVSLLEDEQGTHLVARPGIHLVQVHAGRGTTDVELAWADDLVADHLAPSVESLVGTDPRVLEPHQAVLLTRAVQHGLDVDPEHLAQAIETLATRPGTVHPLALAAAADLAMTSPDAADHLPEMASRMALQPGALTVALHAMTASRLVGGPATLQLPSGVPLPVAGLDETVARAVVEAEVACFRAGTDSPAGPVPRPVERVMALLGAGLPGHTVGPQARALLLAVASRLPEQWEAPRWPVTVPELRELARHRLLAERCDDVSLAWLLLSLES
ncbi:hypothetical protein [Luteococcus sp.]|uniref:hypothetical protein n=1 Tax=Luteococcus sp. TaxID=1969402 RepID=UPI003736A6D7